MIDEKYLASPEEAGIDVDKLAELRARVRQEVDEGFLPAAQFAVAKDGHVVAFESFGAASDDSLFCVFSATKAITSSVSLFSPCWITEYVTRSGPPPGMSMERL